MKKDLCYVVFPDNDKHDWEGIFEEMIVPATEKAGFAECKRGLVMGAVGTRIEQIVSGLNDADLLILDVTDCGGQAHDPTVFYQLGVRHALADHTILIAQSEAHIWRDFLPYHSIIYEMSGVRAISEFKSRFLEIVQGLEREPDQPDNPVRNHLQRDIKTRGEIQQLRKQIAALERRLAERDRQPEVRPAQRIKFKKVSE
jgi:hypothetical protein